MASNSLPDPPVQLKAIQSFMKIASDIERVDPVVAYWVRLYSTETALSIDRESPDCKTFLGAIILWLEQFKKTHKDNETVSNQTVGQAHMENFVVALFNKADTLDREGTANKNTVKMFYMAAVLFEAMAVFGPLTEEISKRVKYAKFKAAYIQKCLKTGQTPKPGPIEGTDLEGDQGADGSSFGGGGGTVDLPQALGDESSKQPPAAAQPPPSDPYILTPSPAPVFPPAPPPKPSVSPNTPQSKPPPPSPHFDRPEPGSAAPSSANTSTNFNQTTRTTGEGTSTISVTKFHATNGAPLNAEDMIKGQKYIKFANSALQYDDVPTAVANLEKALKLLTTGQKFD